MQRCAYLYFSNGGTHACLFCPFALLLAYKRVKHSIADWFFNFWTCGNKIVTMCWGLEIQVVCIVTLFAKFCLHYIGYCTALSDTRTRSPRHGSGLYTLVHKVDKTFSSM
jgi:hypothetical protein